MKKDKIILKHSLDGYVKTWEEKPKEYPLYMLEYRDVVGNYTLHMSRTPKK